MNERMNEQLICLLPLISCSARTVSMIQTLLLDDADSEGGGAACLFDRRHTMQRSPWWVWHWDRGKSGNLSSLAQIWQRRLMIRRVVISTSFTTCQDDMIVHSMVNSKQRVATWMIARLSSHLSDKTTSKGDELSKTRWGEWQCCDNHWW